MDIAQGLSAASTALSIVKQLREIDRQIDESTYKIAIADLTEALADTKHALADAKEQRTSDAETISRLRRELDNALNGDLCPMCKSGHLKLKETKPHRTQGLFHYGVEIWTMLCDDPECQHESRKVHDPHGVVKDAQKKAN